MTMRIEINIGLKKWYARVHRTEIIYVLGLKLDEYLLITEEWSG